MIHRFFLVASVSLLAGQWGCATMSSVEAEAAAPIERVQAVAVQLGAGRINRQFPNELDDRLYLRRVPIDPRGLPRVAGAVLNFYGQVHSDGSCTLDTSRVPSVERRRFTRDSASLTTELLSIVKYQSILDRTAATAGNVIVADLALRDSQLAEVIVEDIAKIEALDALDLAALDSLQQDSLPAGVCTRVVVAAAYLTSVKNRVYRQTSGQAVVTGLGFGLDGKFFVSNSDFGSTLHLSIDARLVRERPAHSTMVRGQRGRVRGIFPAPAALIDSSLMAQGTPATPTKGESGTGLDPH